MRQYTLTLSPLGIFLSSLLMATGIHAGPLESADRPHQESLKAVHDAEHEVDHAWEVYHRAALGGTVASPKLQAEIEEQDWSLNPGRYVGVVIEDGGHREAILVLSVYVASSDSTASNVAMNPSQVADHE